MDCKCAGAGYCKQYDRMMTYGHWRQCQTNPEFQAVLARLPKLTITQEKIDRDAERRSKMVKSLLGVELECVYRSDNPVEFAGCGCHIFDCEIHDRCVPWRKKKLKPGVKVCSECKDRTTQMLQPKLINIPPPRIHVSEIASLLGAKRIKAVCINLDRRPDRWKRFTENCLIEGVERFSAFDAKKLEVPEWWRAGNGAWGCHLSHEKILEDAIQEGLHEEGGMLLVLEDDALFEPDFADRVRNYLRVVPQDWDQIYLGGQHKGHRRPRFINKSVKKGMKVNRTHAYAVNWRYIIGLSTYLSRCMKKKSYPHHVDHRMELKHSQINCYVPTRWLVGQRRGTSDIGKSSNEDRFWR